MKGFTKKTFFDYLKSKKPNASAGRVNICGDCTLARFVHENFPTVLSAEVTGELEIEFKGGKYLTKQLPLWAKNFIFLFDDGKNQGDIRKVATALRFIKIATQYARRGINLHCASTAKVDDIRANYAKQEKYWAELETV